jgi:hypothetical protein
MFKGVVAVALLLGHSVAVSPVQKVLEMMDEMKAKCVKDKQAEVVTFTTFQAFCQDTAKEKLNAIADAKESIAQLAADIMTYDSNAKTLAEEIAKLDSSVATATSNLAEAQAQRDSEKADFDKLASEYESNIADLQGATSKIKTMMSTVKSASAASLIQLVPAKTQVKEMMQAFFDLPENKVKALLDTSNGQDPATPVYESQAGGVVELMKNLEKKLVSEKTVLQQQEAKSVGAFNMIAQTLNDQIASQTNTRDKKLADKQGAEKSSSMAAGQKADTSAALASDEEYQRAPDGLCRKSQGVRSQAKASRWRVGSPQQSNRDHLWTCCHQGWVCSKEAPCLGLGSTSIWHFCTSPATCTGVPVGSRTEAELQHSVCPCHAREPGSSGQGQKDDPRHGLQAYGRGQRRGRTQGILRHRDGY